MDLTIETVKAFLGEEKEETKKDACTIVEKKLDNGFTVIIKYGQEVWKAESESMELVAKHTSVPIPKLYHYFSEPATKTTRRCGYIVMEKVSGKSLASLIKDKKSVYPFAEQISGYLDELSMLRDGTNKWGLPGMDGMYHRKLFCYGPSRITSTKEFVNYFAKAALMPPIEDGVEPGQSRANFDLSRPPIFSHGNVVPENIICDIERNVITSIINWEYAGYYPYFWNAYSAGVYCSEVSWSTMCIRAMNCYNTECRVFSNYFMNALVNNEKGDPDISTAADTTGVVDMIVIPQS